MKTLIVLMMVLLSMGSAFGNDSRQQMQLDRKCELARQKALQPLRKELFEECMANKNDAAVCQSEVEAYNGNRAGRGPMFYDLPECQEAFDNKQLIYQDFGNVSSNVFYYKPGTLTINVPPIGTGLYPGDEKIIYLNKPESYPQSLIITGVGTTYSGFRF